MSGLTREEAFDILEHSGVKGMKWGVRRARVGDLNRQISRLDRVASGNSSALDKARVLGNSSSHNLIKQKGLKNEAARKSAAKAKQRDRLVNGEAKVTDILKAYGSVSILDLARQ